ncbi:MAG: hypothetical protein R6V85_16985 [Polyangia bacterium]
MRIIVVAGPCVAYDAGRALDPENDALSSALVAAGHEVHAVAPLDADVDPEAHSLARRLRPIEVRDTDGGSRSWRRFDGRSPTGVHLHLLRLEDGAEERGSDPFFRVASELIDSLGDEEAWCVTRGLASGIVSRLDRERHPEPPRRHLLLLGAGDEDGSGESLAAADRVAIQGRAAADRILAEDATPIAKMLASGRIVPLPLAVPDRPRLSRRDKAEIKTRFQLSVGLPVRTEVPLVTLEALSSAGRELLPRALREDLQVLALPASEDVIRELLDRYPDRLKSLASEDEWSRALDGADLAVAADRPRRTALAVSRGAVPVTTAACAEGVVEIAPDLSSGSGAIARGEPPASLAEAFQRGIAAFHRGEEFRALQERIQGYSVSWKRLAELLTGLMDLDLERPTQPDSGDQASPANQ